METDLRKPPVVLIILQNAWSRSYAGRLWPRDNWLKTLHQSRSGKRLAVLTSACPRIKFLYDNTTSAVAEGPSIFLPPDYLHVSNLLRYVDPRFVVACGRHAAKAVLPLRLAGVLVIPHPAHRLLTNKLLQRAAALLVTGFDGNVELRQKKGYVEERRIPSRG